jgi:hypothetical protein
LAIAKGETPVTQFFNLRSGGSGPPFVGSSQDDAVLWDTTARAWYVGPLPSGGGAAGALRAKWAFRANTTFLDNASTGDILSSTPGTYASVQEGDTLFVPPVFALGPPFHSGPAAPEFGGIYVVTAKADDQTLSVTRDPRMATAAQIAATALVSADQGDGAAVYQVVTPAAAVLDVDPQVMEMCALPAHAADADVYALQSLGGLLQWVIVPS